MVSTSHAVLIRDSVFLNQSVRLFEWSRFQIWHFLRGSEREKECSNNYFPHYFGKVEDVVVCRSDLAVTGIGKDRGVWVRKLHEQVHPRCFVFTETDKPSASFGVILPVLLYISDCNPGKKVFIITVFCLSLCFTCHFLVWYVMHWDRVPLWQQKDCFLFFCLVKENFVRHMQYAHEKLLVLNFS